MPKTEPTKDPVEISKRIQAQKDYLEKSGEPHFAPKDGRCFNCKRQIYEIEDGTTLVTGCPHCHRSYCE